MIDGSAKIEIEFNKFMKSSFGDDFRRLPSIQIVEMKRAFIGGIVIGCLTESIKNREEMLAECKDFFKTEVSNFKKSMLK